MEEFDFYPQKPELIEHKPKTGLSLTIFSLVLFILLFLMVAGNELNFLVQLIVVLVIHEMGHFLLMKYFKYENVRMLFVPLMGAFVQGSKKRYSQRESFLVTAAGPFPGMILSVLCIYLASISEIEWLMSLGLMFMLLNLINLIPLDPLDGGQLFKLFSGKNHELFLMVFAFISSLTMIAIGFFLFQDTTSKYLVIAFGFMMGFRVRALQKRYQVHKDLKEEEVNYSTTYKLLSNRDFLKIKQVLIEHTPALQKYLDQVSEAESDPVMASQVNNVLVTPMVRDASILFKILLLLFWIASFLVPVGLVYLIDINWYLNAV